MFKKIIFSVFFVLVAFVAFKTLPTSAGVGDLTNFSIASTNQSAGSETNLLINYDILTPLTQFWELIFFVNGPSVPFDFSNVQLNDITVSINGVPATVTEHFPGDGTMGIITMELPPMGASIQIVINNVLNKSIAGAYPFAVMTWDAFNGLPIDSTSFDFVYIIEEAVLPGSGTLEDPWLVTECLEIDESGYYKLVNDILNVNSTCINITADDVVFYSENGRTISSLGNGSGILLDNVDNVEISNINVGGFYTQIEINSSTNSSILNSDIIMHGYWGIYVSGGSSGITISENTISGSLSDSIIVFGPVSEIEITDNTISNFYGSGLNIIGDVSDTLVSLNHIGPSANGNNGIRIQGPNELGESNITVSNNAIEEVNTGIRASNLDFLNISSNSISDIKYSPVIVSSVNYAAINFNYIFNFGILEFQNEDEEVDYNIGISLNNVIEFSMSYNTIDDDGNGINTVGLGFSGNTYDEEIPLEDLSRSISQNTIATEDVAILLDGTDFTTFYSNILKSDKWIINNAQTNMFSYSSLGNTYLYKNGDGAWTVFDILDGDNDGFADLGTDLPFNQDTLGVDLWQGFGSDEHPRTLVAYVEPEPEPEPEPTVSNNNGVVSAFFLQNVSNQMRNEIVKDTSSEIAVNVKNLILFGLPTNFRFNDNLMQNLTNNNVRLLQIFLNNNGFIVSESGPGSKGMETSFFGPKTYRALVRFQEVHGDEILKPLNLKNGTGYFGPYSRKFINDYINQNQ